MSRITIAAAGGCLAVLLGLVPAQAETGRASGTTGATAPVGEAMTMEQAVAAAVRWHPSLRSAHSRVQQAGASVDAARAAYYPSVSAGVNTQISDDRIAGYRDDTIYQAELSVSQLLYDFGQTGSQVEQAKASQDVAQARVGLAYADVVQNTVSAWLRVRQYRALAQVAADQLDAVKDLAQLAREREAEGASTHSDTTQAEARKQAAQGQLLQARARVQRWRTELMQWVGASQPPGVTGEPVAALDSACRVEGAVAAAQQAESVRVAREQLGVARAAEAVAAKQLWPTLTLEATASHALGTRSQRVNGDDNDYTLMLDMSVPLFQGGSLRSNKRAAAYAAEAARSSLLQARVSADRGLRGATLQWQRYHALAPVQQQREKNMRVTRKLYRSQYLQLGTRSLLDLLNAEQEYYGVLSDEIDNQYNMYQLGLNCLYYSGGLRDVFAMAAPRQQPFAADDGLRFPGVPDLGNAGHPVMSPAAGFRLGDHE